MFTSVLGVRLILWMGETVPRPAPYEVTTALSSVEVTNDSENGDGFQIVFTLSKDKSRDYSLLQSSILSPFSRIIIGVLLGVSPEVLIDGVITHHQISPSDEPGMSTLTVMGRDISLMMDLEEKNEEYKNQPDFLIVNRILANYAQYGLIPPFQVTPTTDVPIELQRVPRQWETDAQFIQRLAQRNSFVFYTEPVTFGVNTAYWGRENRLGVPQPALTMNMGAYTNLISLNFANDFLGPVGTEGYFVEPITKQRIPIPPLPSLRIPPLSGSSTPAKRRVQLRRSANQNPAQAALSAVSTVTNSPEAVRGQGELDTVRYGNILRARKLVGLRGAGLSYDGFYYVRSVTHSIRKGEYKQRFTLSREGTGALLPVVRVSF
ncbi:phage late control D family protein [Nostoc sp. CCY 9925]|uniref:phage late control D family protein n=1 Tax=Nostoc sp. CCY 9925 TaxID=3103865 RepID=UPI0039C619AB